MATDRSSSIASATAAGRTPSSSRWRASAWRRPRPPALPQEIGPLNPYARRLVHITVADDPAADVGEHRRRVPEDGHHFRCAAEPAARARRRLNAQPRQSNMFSDDDTIVAVATPSGRGGLGVVRMSGRESAADRGDADASPAAARAQARDVRALRRSRAPGAGGLGDQVILTFFPGPHSYTGEDVVEISAHGSPVLLRAVVESAMAEGARLAEPGEFTLRAFLHGRIDLVQAEAVRDLDRRGDAAPGSRRLRSARRHADRRDRARRPRAVRPDRASGGVARLPRRGLSLRRVRGCGARDRRHHRASSTRCSRARREDG